MFNEINIKIEFLFARLALQLGDYFKATGMEESKPENAALISWQEGMKLCQEMGLKMMFVLML